ncbi:MAG: hypothetical protein ACI9G1_001750 [Pirellulaceae bacterium]
MKKVARIYFGLSLFAISMLIVANISGYWVGDYVGAANDLLKVQRETHGIEHSSTATREQIEEARDRRVKQSAIFEPIAQRRTMHTLISIAAALVTVLVNSITVTYFIGTGKWCHEVVEAYRLEDELIERSGRLKSRAFPWSIFGICMVLVMSMLGAVSDPGVSLDKAVGWLTWHHIIAILGTLGTAIAFFMQIGKIGANYELIDEILQQVRKERQRRGLDTDDLEEPNSEEDPTAG